MSSIQLKPNKPEVYDGSREFLKASIWLYSVEQFLSIAQLSSPTIAITDQNRISFAKSFQTGNDSVWSYNLVNYVNTPGTWEEFKQQMTTEFIPAEHTNRAREKLRHIKQTSSIERYFSEFINTVLLIGNMSEGEKLDRFADGLKFEIKVELMRAGPGSFQESARIALNFDIAIWRARKANFGYQKSTVRFINPTPHGDWQCQGRCGLT